MQNGNKKKHRVFNRMLLTLGGGAIGIVILLLGCLLLDQDIRNIRIMLYVIACLVVATVFLYGKGAMMTERGVAFNFLGIRYKTVEWNDIAYIARCKTQKGAYLLFTLKGGMDYFPYIPDSLLKAGEMDFVDYLNKRVKGFSDEYKKGLHCKLELSIRDKETVAFIEEYHGKIEFDAFDGIRLAYKKID